MKTMIAIALAVLAVGCSSEDPAPDQEPVKYFPECDETDFSPGPLDGPGWDDNTGLVAPVLDEYVVSTTALKVRPEKNAEFFALAASVSLQMQTSEGFMARSLATSMACGSARTISVWRSVEDMYGFVNTGAHAEAMSRPDEVGEIGVVTHFMAPASDIPITWEVARERLREVPAF